MFRRKKNILYNSRTFTNRIFSFFSRKKRSSQNIKIVKPEIKTFNKKQFLKWFLSICAILIFLANIYWVFLSGYFNVKKIFIESYSNYTLSIDKDNIEVSMSKFLGENIFFIFENDISNYLKELYPTIKYIEVLKNYPQIIRVKIKEYDNVAIAFTPNGNFVLNEMGIVSDADITKYKELLQIQLDTNKKAIMYQNLIKKETLNFIFLQLKNIFNAIGKHIKKVYFNDESLELKYYLEGDIVIRCELDQDMDRSLFNVKKMLEKIDIEKISEIDTRLVNKIYIKYKEDK